MDKRLVKANRVLAAAFMETKTTALAELKSYRLPPKATEKVLKVNHTLPHYHQHVTSMVTSMRQQYDIVTSYTRLPCQT